MTIETTIREDAVDVEEAVEADNVSIQEDDAAVEEAEAQKSSRDQIVDKIAEKRNEEVQAEILPDAPAADAEELVEKKIKVKVDGVESEVTEAEIREYQKQKAADVRMQNIAKEREALEAREAEIKAKEDLLIQRGITPSGPPAPVEKPVNKFSEDDADNLITAVFAEDKAKVMEIMSKAGAGAVAPQVVTQPATISAEEFNRRLDAREAEKARVDAVAKFEKEYPDLNENFKSVVDNQTVVEMEKTPDAAPWEIIQRAAEHVKKVMSESLGVAPEKKVEAVKRTTTPIRSTVSKRFQQPVRKAAAKTPFEEIASTRYQG